MPGRNGTGPSGYGQMSGRGFGPCNGNNAMDMYGRGNSCGCGRGMGRGYNNANGFDMNITTRQVTQEEQKEMLDIRKEYLQNELKYINDQLEDM